jgi:hypothetical protein
MLLRPAACLPAAPGKAAGAFFLPAAAFEGAKPGYVFKLDGSGLGYYRDQQLPTAGSLFGAPSASAGSGAASGLSSMNGAGL